MSLLRGLGKKHIELATKWVAPVITYGTAASLGVVYFTDWKVVLQYVPFYNTKFEE
ncbi:cytochrome b-c1 complex subunit 10-like [Agrilus planipennis]|uniref:Cytochrome b-c1 complex subunit 10-like n=1 Tax=Agrilus planipennis TaxID=224129 RepID=A0A1W4XBT4_AGRPL|nr:cytochrome b-c1 complex subunit 10-like [Agrilus planipennis]